MYQGLALSTSMFELRKESMMAAANSPWHAYDALYKEVAALHLRPRLHGTAAAERPLPDRETLPRHVPGAEGGSTAGSRGLDFRRWEHGAAPVSGLHTRILTNIAAPSYTPSQSIPGPRATLANISSNSV